MLRYCIVDTSVSVCTPISDIKDTRVQSSVKLNIMTGSVHRILQTISIYQYKLLDVSMVTVVLGFSLFIIITLLKLYFDVALSNM